ncbi:MAG: GIY-YIG nuclease family protein [Chloroflexaceae bacterium]|nr:GIY-YIG nuclease family protein [Chloroflexaceae bacterium]
MKGTYLCILHLATALRQLPVGKLGKFDCAPGYYLYIGKAFGPGGVPARLRHHQKPTRTRPHWHLDYLVPHTRLTEVWTVSPLNLETAWCEALAAIPDLSIPIRGFGASDSPCTAHLFYSPVAPPCRWLSQSLLSCLPLDSPNGRNVHIAIHLCQKTP